MSMGERERHYCHPISQTSQRRFDSNLMILGFYAARKIGELRETWNILAGVTVAATFEIYNSRAYIFEQWQFFCRSFLWHFWQREVEKKRGYHHPFFPDATRRSEHVRDVRMRDAWVLSSEEGD